MPQVQLPLFPAGSRHLNESLAVECRDGQVTYYNGHLPVFRHAQADLAAFRLFTSQLVVNGSASQGDIRRAFGVPKIAVQRAVDRDRAGGAAAFFTPPKARPGRRLTPAVLSQVQALLEQGQSVPQVGAQTGVLANTIHKAIRAGRLRAGAKKKPRPPASSVHSKRTARRRSSRPAGLRHHAHRGTAAGRRGGVAAGAGAV
jgi:hypothetical protein